MNNELKKAIIAYIFEHEKEYQLPNNVTDKFRAYIYDNSGEYLIGGENVKDFIDKSIDLLTKL